MTPYGSRRRVSASRAKRLIYMDEQDGWDGGFSISSQGIAFSSTGTREFAPKPMGIASHEPRIIKGVSFLRNSVSSW